MSDFGISTDTVPQKTQLCLSVFQTEFSLKPTALYDGMCHDGFEDTVNSDWISEHADVVLYCPSRKCPMRSPDHNVSANISLFSGHCILPAIARFQPIFRSSPSDFLNIQLTAVVS